jgi:hypothetical protein
MSQRAGYISAASFARDASSRALAINQSRKKFSRIFHTRFPVRMEQGLPPPKKPMDTIFGKIVRKEIPAKVFTLFVPVGLFEAPFMPLGAFATRVHSLPAQALSVERTIDVVETCGVAFESCRSYTKMKNAWLSTMFLRSHLCIYL